MTKIALVFISSQEAPWIHWEATQAQVMETLVDVSKSEGIEMFWVQGSQNSKPNASLSYTSLLSKITRALSVFPLAPHLLRVFRLPSIRLGVTPQIWEELVGGRRIIKSSHPEDFSLIAMKTIDAIQHILKDPDVHFVFRSNSSTIVNPVKLRQITQQFPGTRLYAGVIGRFGAISYISGAGILMSRDVCELLVKGRNQIRLDLVDDVAIGQYLSALHIPVKDLSRADAPTFFGADEALCVSYRCKSGDQTPAMMRKILGFLMAEWGHQGQ